MNKRQFSHGDVLLERVDINVSNAKVEEKKAGRWIIAEGEHTGHAHAIIDSDTVVVEQDGFRYIISENGFTITHEEHLPIEIPSGTYQIGITREFDYFENEARHVSD